MSDEIKLKWETVTKWILRSAIGLMSLVFTVGGAVVYDVFTEMRGDVKRILENQQKLQGRIDLIQQRTDRNERDIDKLTQNTE